MPRLVHIIKLVATQLHLGQSWARSPKSLQKLVSNQSQMGGVAPSKQ